MLNDIKTTNKLLLIIVIPLVFYLLKILSFIFIPLVGAMFVAMLFMPLMRWLNKRKIPRWISLIFVVMIILGFLRLGGEVIQLSSRQILSADTHFWDSVEAKLDQVIIPVETFFGIETDNQKKTKKES